MLFYRIVRGIASPFFRLLIRFRVQGLENIPDSGPCVIAANHIHAMDPFFLAVAVRRPICFMSKEEILHWPILGWLASKAGVFPVKRGKIDVQAVRHSLQILAGGGMLGIFPEGTRSKTGELQEALGGAVLLATRTDAALIPVALAGRYRLGGVVKINIGQPLAISSAIAGKPSSEERAAGTKLLMQQIAHLKQQSDLKSW